MDLEDCVFEEIGDGSAKVYGSKISKSPEYKIKLEGARRVGYRTFVIAGIRDPLFIKNIDEIETAAKKMTEEYYSEIDRDS